MSHAKLNVIVQAGGRGSRLRHHTWNKPKCLVSVRGKPLLYHTFERFPAAEFWIIGDYAYEQLEKYLRVNPPQVNFHLLKAGGHGTASGIADAQRQIPADSPLILVWSDLIVGDLPEWPGADKPVLCTTSAFTCRWTVANDGTLQEAPAAHNGIPGLFYFPRAKLLPPPPDAGEFVRWFATHVTDFELVDCNALQELGDFTTLESSNDAAGFSRFFNRVEVGPTTVCKQAVDPAYQHLIEKEQSWYRAAAALGFRRIPQVISESPFVLQRIDGQHLYRMNDLSKREQGAVFADYLDALVGLHQRDSSAVRRPDIEEVYVNKTVNRVKSVAAIVPGFNKDSMTINGRKCRNVFAAKHVGFIESLLPRLLPDYFTPIHGDATFSNTLIDGKLRTWFIDPRGYFAEPGIMGDPWYDFAKVYYSAVGGYDAFNRRKFKLHVDEETVEILFEEPLYADTARSVFKEYFGAECARIEVLHSLIWLSLCGYALDDIDSVIGSFYFGLYWMEEAVRSL